MKRGWSAAAIVLMIGLLMAACGSGDDAGTPPSTATPAAPATPATAPVTLAGVGEIVWTSAVDPSSHAPSTPIEELPTDAPQVIAALPVGMLPAGTVVQARWTIDGNALPQLDSVPITVGEGRVDAWLTWTLRWEGEQPWPTGQLAIAVDIGGTAERRAEIPIVRSAGDAG